MNDTTTPLAFTDPLLLAYRDRIAELRDIKCDLTAGILRDELLSQIEAWIDPSGLAVRMELRENAAQTFAKMALDIDPVIGF